MTGNDRLRINITRDAGAIVVVFVGDLDVFVADEARAHLDEAINRAVVLRIAGLDPLVERDA